MYKEHYEHHTRSNSFFKIQSKSSKYTSDSNDLFKNGSNWIKYY